MNMALHLTIQSDLFVIVGLTAVLCLAVVLISKVIDKLLGKDQVKKLKDHVRIKDGTVPTDKITEEITDIFENSGEELKNL